MAHTTFVKILFALFIMICIVAIIVLPLWAFGVIPSKKDGFKGDVSARRYNPQRRSIPAPTFRKPLTAINAAEKFIAGGSTEVDNINQSTDSKTDPSGTTVIQQQANTSVPPTGGSDYLARAAKNILPNSIYASNRRFWGDQYARTQTTSKETLLDDTAMLPISRVGVAAFSSYSRDTKKTGPDDYARQTPSIDLNEDVLPSQPYRYY